ncbi:MAG: hypothetical protein IT461_14615 [Planctomycetes bacterium]|nr:hypothetical protein [Planctomycetota bacterium]
MEPKSTTQPARLNADASQDGGRAGGAGWHRTIGGPGKLALIAVGLFLVLWGLGFAYKEYQLRHPSDEVRAAEARAALGAMKDRARVVYQKNPTLKEISFDDLGMGKIELSGSYFSSENFTCGGTPEKWWAQCDNVYESEPRYLRIEANLVQGSASFNR